MARSKRILRRVAFAVACTAPLLAACNALLGISEYEKAECNGGEPCNRVDGGPDSPFDAPATDAKPDVITIVDAQGAAPVSWARWRMPNYGDGSAPVVPVDSIPTLNPTQDGGLEDSVSKRVWRPVQASEKDTTLSYADAQKFCETAAPTGAWRLPTRIELVTLFDPTRSDPLADPLLNMTSDGPYWTSSAYRTVGVVGPQNWGVRFFAGESNVLPRIDTTAGKARAICILLR